MTDAEKLQKAIELLDYIARITAALNDSPNSLQFNLNSFTDDWLSGQFEINPRAAGLGETYYQNEFLAGYTAHNQGLKRESNPWDRNSRNIQHRYQFLAWEKGWMKADEEKGA